MNLILQINARGAWREVVEFDAKQLAPVQDAAMSLALALRGQTFRVVKAGPGRSPKTVAHLVCREAGPHVTYWEWRSR